jgi:hypothetical protein
MQDGIPPSLVEAMMVMMMMLVPSVVIVHFG